MLARTVINNRQIRESRDHETKQKLKTKQTS